MKPAIFAVLIITHFFYLVESLAEKNAPSYVIEESYYKVDPEHEDEFLELFKKKIFPFWKEMEKLGLIEGEIRMYTQRVHTLEPSWSYKTVVKFKNYSAIDKWLEKREEIFNKLFPEEGGYNNLRKKVMVITEDHWDELIKEIPLKQ
jgi:heme-degrading monooxygenase HmoA